ncbi:arabinofuranosyltransferase [Blastococcus sp. TF02-9]|uniref:arabinofuranosyltransferase n=1 Tax=Blastococcus sp. TF02-09 TaxID=2250576 RepID=UPI001314B83F|nr:arabinofuranosyltransferase [Blastococcus sp. TF02-9]
MSTPAAEDVRTAPPPPSPAPRARRHVGRLRPLLLLAAALVGWAVTAGLVALWDVSVVEEEWRDRLVPVLTVLGGVAGVAVALAARHRPRAAADAGAVLAGVLIGAAATAALHGTRWGWGGLYSDSAFRTQMATRYAETPGLFDYNYRGLPAYYPPALGWIQGRLAALTDVPGWEAVKPVQLLVGVLVPLAAYLLWRPVAGALPAAALVTIWTAEPHKPDEWLVLACLLPWFLLAVRDVRAPGVARWPAWRLGAVLGLLALVHTYWFLPFGLATLLALAYDAVRRRVPRRSGPPRAPVLPLRRAAAIGAVAVAVAAPTWVPLVVARLRFPSDGLQLRYGFPGGHELVLPSVFEEAQAAGVVGLVWLAWATWCRLRGRDLGGATYPLAAGLGLAVLGCCATLGLGALAERADVGFLAFKTQDALLLVLLAAGVVGAADWLGRWSRRTGPAARAAWLPRLAAVVVAGGAAASAAHHLAADWVVGHHALTAQTTRYPDGSVPAGDPDGPPYIPTLFVDPADPPVTEVRAAWRELRPDVPLDEAVLVTSQVDLLATTPVHGFLTFKSIYSHPNGRFEDRRELLEEVADCPTSACAADLLRSNDFDAVDGLVLQRTGEDLLLPFTVDDFPDRTVRDAVAFPDRVLTGPEFERIELGRIVVVALRR